MDIQHLGLSLSLSGGIENEQGRGDSPTAQLVRAAQSEGGKLSVTQGVAATGMEFTQVEALLNKLVKTDYVDIDNDSEIGIVIYQFGELASYKALEADNIIA